MALTDIIQAIAAHAEKEIARLQEQLLASKKEMNIRTDSAIEEYKMKLEGLKKEHIRQMETRSRGTLQMRRKSELLSQKRLLIDEIYNEVLPALLSQPEEEQKKLLDALLCRIKTHKGEICPAACHAKLIEKLPHFDAKRFTIGKPIDAVGGFIVRSDVSEESFTYELLLAEDLRAKTELSVATELFPA